MNLLIEDKLFRSSKVEAPKVLKFKNSLSWVNYSNVTIYTNKTFSIKFTNLFKPSFKIGLPDKIIATSNANQVINLKVDNYKDDKLKEFKFTWKINPEIKGGETSFNGRQYIIKSGGL